VDALLFIVQDICRVPQFCCFNNILRIFPACTPNSTPVLKPHSLRKVPKSERCHVLAMTLECVWNVTSCNCLISRVRWTAVLQGPAAQGVCEAMERMCEEILWRLFGEKGLLLLLLLLVVGRTHAEEIVVVGGPRVCHCKRVGRWARLCVWGGFVSFLFQALYSNPPVIIYS
jgi:hypothetical protein